MTSNNQNYETARNTQHINDYGYKVITEYNNNDQRVKETTYRPSFYPDGYLDHIAYYDPQSQTCIKDLSYDENTLDYIEENDSQTGYMTKHIDYFPDGSIFYISTYDPQSGDYIDDLVLSDLTPVEEQQLQQEYQNAQQAYKDAVQLYHSTQNK
ncbi:DUF2963 domain-containing protein [Candidatus Phytoplasma pruni]|uniref:DUF2963 domain-containing protein n=1 Tax=Candidatus Phytoplasma pruni TaxID=479893 RepID=A0A851HCB7_9MOLU|nr:DUF2963 domain-containing protein [Candidatus Phytoplasma pruni]NWN45715.1 DUF2963 domain-containing protein [Candidatus Phytoplasma pruni]